MDYDLYQDPENQYPRSAFRLGTQARVISLIGGIASLGLAGTRRSWPGRIPWMIIGGLCLYQSATGINLANRLMGIRESTGQTENGFVVERVMTINRQAADVYSFWRRFENFPTFMRHLVDVQELGDDRSHWIANGPLGTRIEWTAQVTEDIPEKRIAWRSLPGAQIENEGVVNFTTSPGNRGTEVKVRIVYRPPAGSAGIMLSKLFGAQPNMVVLEDLRRFKQIMEAGEIPTTRGQISGRERQRV